MYTEEYDQKGFPFRDFLLKLILIIIFVFLLVWLLPKFISPKVVNKNTTNTTENSALTSQIFSDNITKMKEAAISYYTEERLPKEISETYKMTLSEMIGKKLLVPLIDKKGKACDVEKSYVEITKLDTEFILKVNLKCSGEGDYILVHLGCYNYCNSYVCEKNETAVTIKATKPTTNVVIKGDKPTSTPSPTEKPTPTPDPIPDPTPVPDPDPENKPGYIYEYTKTTGTVFSAWTSWSNWDKTNCTTQAVLCNDSDSKCLLKRQLYNRKEQIGTYQNAYVKSHQETVQTASYSKSTCSNYNYVIINNITYATTKTTNYTTINSINSTSLSIGSWTLIGRGEYDNPPRDTATEHYEFVGANYSYCSDTCTTLPKFYYNKFVLNDTLTSVSSTTTPGTSSSSTSSSTSSSVSASCGNIETTTVPVYSTITKYDKAYRTESLYGTVCYQSTKTRTIKSSGKTTIKWSKYDDTSLLNDGWTYTGNKKKSNK